jgi:phosphoribosylformimino-5-aminoimidazole carboxamide ribotide isomerase
MELLAAIDLRGGNAVRLLKGDYAQETGYGDPLAMATALVAGGADWLHLVDLDAARDGGRANRSVIMEIARTFDVPVETGGGVRRLEDVEELVEGGVARVILGTAALESPEVLRTACRAFPGHVAVGLDYRRRADGVAEVAVRGWLEGAGTGLLEAVALVAQNELDALVVTAIDRDGTLEGPDIEGLAAVLDATGVAVVASAGVSSATDLRALAAMTSPATHRRLAGAVVGKAIAEGLLGVEEAVAACR